MDVRFVSLKPTANPSLTWIKGNHSYKFGGELVVESHPDSSRSYANNYYYFSPNQTADPSLNLSGTTLPSGTAIGFAYASFLMGNYNQVTSNTTARGHLGNHAIRFFRAGHLEDHAQTHLRLRPALRFPNLPEGAVWPNG